MIHLYQWHEASTKVCYIYIFNIIAWLREHNVAFDSDMFSFYIRKLSLML